LRLGFSLLTLQVVFLVALQFTCLVVLWLISPLTQAATDTFALYLSLDLLAFAMTSYIYRSRRNAKEPNQAWMAGGYLALTVLLVSNLLLA
jgi:hypothetical protein